MDWSFANALKLSYWFALTTPPLRRSSLLIVLLVLAVCFAAALVLRFMVSGRRDNPPFAQALIRVGRPLFFISILSFVLVEFRQLGAAVLSARGWLAAVGFIAAVWLFCILRSIRRTYRTEYVRMQEEKEYRAYLPKKKA